MKKIISLALAMMLILSLVGTVSADETGSITISNIGSANTYSVYKVLDLESYDTASGAYSYKVNSAWTGFFAAGVGGLDYITIDDAGYVTWTAAEDDATVAAFAKKALAYAKANGISATQSITTTTETSIKFNNLALGYYLIDSTMGALCGLTTTNPDASITAKNGAPTIDKQVKEDSTSQWGEENTADIGQIVEFRVTINVHAGAENFRLHDTMSDGLTFKEVVSVEHVVPDVTTETATEGTHYTVHTTEGKEDSCTFEIKFSQDFCDHLEDNDKIVITYTAMLNRFAVTGVDGNTNKAHLDYGDDHTTSEDVTVTKTYGFEIFKTDSQHNPLQGAEFKIYDAAEGGNEVAVVPLMQADNITPIVDAAGNPMYRRARADETGVSIVISGANGIVRVVGFDNGKYYLEETKSPLGYNQLTGRQLFTISDADMYVSFNAGGIYDVGTGVQVINKTGTMLPETGAMGTVLFVTFGVFVMLGTGVLLVTKKRMSMIED